MMAFDKRRNSPLPTPDEAGRHSDLVHSPWRHLREATLMIFRRKDGAVNRYNLALLLLTLAVIPLFHASIWLGAIALVAAYGLVARLANRDFDRQHRKGGGPVLPLRNR